MPPDSISHVEFAGRRAGLLKALDASIGLVIAGDYDPANDEPFRPHRHFEYLTGITDEPGAVLLLDPRHPVQARREMLFLRPLNPEIEQWDGLRMPVAAPLRQKTGLRSIFRLDKLGMLLLDAARRSKSLACLHPLAQHTQPVSPDLQLFRLLAERVPGTRIEDRADEIPRMRWVKSSREIAMVKRAAEITARGFTAMFSAMRPGVHEFDIQQAIEQAYYAGGSRSLSFPPIVGSGVNSTVLHYRANDKRIEAGDLVCVDSGARWAGYCADVTRTVPASGRFTKRQREIYDIVLRAQRAAIMAVKPGVRISQLDSVARSIIDKAGLGDFFIHGIGHHLGLDTHDPAPSGDLPLRAGAVITIEPGVYIPSEAIGVRIEDDVLVTRDRARVLTAAIPKNAADIERLMRHRAATNGKSRRARNTGP